MLATLPYLKATSFPAIQRQGLDTLQVNLGYRCNQRCLHCHVNAGPKRTEVMSGETVAAVLAFLRQGRVQTLDVTGGAPEMNPHFKELVRQARSLGLTVIDRCNLTILQEPGYEGLADFLAEQGVEVVASMPCYLEENVNAQRGKGVFAKSIAALKHLNRLGYGQDPDKRLNLVYNPQGASLPPAQESLEQDYKKHLMQHYGIRFNQLFTLVNMPIQRFGSTLLSKGEFHTYMTLLHEAHQEANLEAVMCRHLVSVDWLGRVYDCDFNQLLGLPMQRERGDGRRGPIHISELAQLAMAGRSIAVRDHCYGCTAGQGSSCGGALS